MPEEGVEVEVEVATAVAEGLEVGEGTEVDTVVATVAILHIEAY